MKRYFLVFILILIIKDASFAQSIGGSAPLSFGVQSPTHGVDLSSGTLNISIPIDNTIVPLALSYSAGGIKINQISGPYGLGWNFSAEAYIIREVRGLPDDAENGYSGKNKRGNAVNATLSYTNAKSLFFDNIWDAEPDVFRYQFLGYSGAFILDPNRNVIKLTHDNVKIKVNYSDASAFYSFEATDPQGNIYYLNRSETMTNQVDTNPSLSYKYKWHLTSVKYYNSSKTLLYVYSNLGTITTQNTFQYGSPNSGSTGPLSVSTLNIKNSWSPNYISKISINRYSLIFEYDNRTDIANSKRLKSIKVQEDSKTLNQFEFNYEYFSNEGTDRLKLKSVYRVNPELSTEKKLITLLNYNGEGVGEKVLPAYNSKKQDHWGYYNNNSINSLFVYDGANREPSIAETKACTIKKVNFPSGKSEEYEYELNTYFNGSLNKNAGGLRIKSITTKDDSNISFVKTYDFSITGHSSGNLYNLPQYYRYMYWYDPQIVILDRDIYRIFSYRPLFDFNGRHIIYEKITTTSIDGSQIENTYKTYSDEMSVFPYYPTRYKIKIDRVTSQLSGHTSSLVPDNETPFGSNSYLGVLAGYPESIIYRNSDGNKLREEQFSYQYYNGSPVNHGIAFLLHKFYVNYNVDTWYAEYYIGKYKIQPYYFKLSTKTTIEYDANDINKNVSLKTDYTYNPSNFLVSKTESYNVGETSDHSIQEITYLVDNATGVLNVPTHNLVNHVKTVKSKKDGQLLAHSENYYINDAQGEIVLDEERSFSPQGSIASKNSYTYQNGVVVQSLDNIKGQYNSIILDDDLNNVIATVSNSSIDRTAYSSFELNEIGNWNISTLVSSEECEIALQDCQSNCDNSTCEQNCYIAYSNCQSSANISSQGRTGQYSYILSKSNITKTGLPLISYIISYWYKSGSVVISGVSSNTLLSSFTNNGWTYHERKIQASSSTLTISGTALIDELRLYPEQASMATKTNTCWGPSSETDINNFSAFVEYDSYGRAKFIKDNNKDIIKAYQYNFGEYAFTNADSYGASGTGGNITVNIFSNTGWSVSDNVSWITLSPANGTGNGQLTVNCSANGGSSSRNGIVTISISGVSKDITINQDAGPYLTCPNYIPLSASNPSASFTVNSNISWITTNIDYVAGSSGWLNLGLTSGTGTKTFTISTYGSPPSGNTWVAEFDVIGSGITKTVTVVFSSY